MSRAALALGVLALVCTACARPDTHGADGQSAAVACPETPLAQAPPPDGNTARLTTTWYTDGTLWAGPVPPYRGQWYAGPQGMKVGWWRATRGKLSITGRRLDGQAPALQASVPDGYGETGFQSTMLTFPTEGCWEIVARVGSSHTFRIVAEVQHASAHPLAPRLSPTAR
jgi:hypothetical protein